MEFQIIVFSATYLVIGLGLIGYIFSYLEKHHNGRYVALGSPSLITNNSASNNWLFLKFIFTNSYKEINDSVLSRLCVSLKYIQVVWLLLIMAVPAYFINIA
jgi:hypothetical protein